MGKMQPFKFTELAEYYDFLGKEEFVLVKTLKDILEESVPNLKVKLAYNTLFFYGRKNMFFIWPPSIRWGKKGPRAVQLGFIQGYLLHDPNGLLEAYNRKQVRIIHYNAVEDIDPEVIQNFAIQAYDIDRS